MSSLRKVTVRKSGVLELDFDDELILANADKLNSFLGFQLDWSKAQLSPNSRCAMFRLRKGIDLVIHEDTILRYLTDVDEVGEHNSAALSYFEVKDEMKEEDEAFERVMEAIKAKAKE